MTTHELKVRWTPVGIPRPSWDDEDVARQLLRPGEKLFAVILADDLAAMRRALEALRAHELAVAQAVGIVYETDGRAPEAGPRETVLGEVRRVIKELSDVYLHETAAELARLKEPGPALLVAKHADICGGGARELDGSCWCAASNYDDRYREQLARCRALLEARLAKEMEEAVEPLNEVATTTRDAHAQGQIQGLRWALAELGEGATVKPSLIVRAEKESAK